MTKLIRLKREFFSRNTVTVAKELLGRYLVRNTKKETLIGKIIEVEAYLSPNDKASHSYNYKKTERTKIMYQKPGTFYIYLIYGMYYCLNIITEPQGIPCAVLIRQLYPVKGIETMKSYRNAKVGKNFKNLTDGPGKICMALNISKKKFNGIDSCAPDSKLFFTYGEEINPDHIIYSKRIGIEYAQEARDKLLRFTLKFTSNY